MGHLLNQGRRSQMLSPMYDVRLTNLYEGEISWPSCKKLNVSLTSLTIGSLHIVTVMELLSENSEGLS